MLEFNLLNEIKVTKKIKAQVIDFKFFSILFL